MAEVGQATLFLAEMASGDKAAADRLLPLIYEELRALAGSYFRQQRADHTLQPTALVHEAFVRLIDRTNPTYADRRHFLAVAATAMRQILTDHARRARAVKRGGRRDQVAFEEPNALDGVPAVDLIALDDALTQLAQLDSRQHRVVELRFFGGLAMEEIATVLDVSKATVELDWRAARAWLGTQLQP